MLTIYGLKGVSFNSFIPIFWLVVNWGGHIFPADDMLWACQGPQTFVGQKFQHSSSSC